MIIYNYCNMGYFTVLLFAIFVGSGSCALENGILDDLKNIALGIFKNPICVVNDILTEVDATELKYNLYNKNRANTPIVLTNTSASLKQILPSLQTIVMIQGWIEDLEINPWPLKMKDAYLTKLSDANFIHIDWTAYSQKRLLTATCNAQGVGEAIGTFLSNLITNYSIDPKKIHVLGFSLGGQVTGFAGQKVQSMTGKKLGKITGMDIVGVGFESPLQQPANKRLSVDDATEVIGIHTNGLVNGIKTPYGRVDFYANNGLIQPQCLVPSLFELLQISNVIEFVKLFFCSHFKAPIYKINSIIDENRYIGFKCSNAITWSTGLCRTGDKLALKEDVNASATGTYYFSATD